MLSLNMFKIKPLEFTNVLGLDLVEVASDTSIKYANLKFSGHWHVLSLLQEFCKLLTSVEKLLCGGIKIGTELSESSDLSVLSKIKLHGTGHLLHSLDLSGRTDSRYRKTDINSWSDTLVEKLSFQENLSVSNGDNVCWDVSRDITSLSLNNWKGGQRTTSLGLVHLSCSLEKTRMKIEDITWVSLTTWWSSQQK